MATIQEAAARLYELLIDEYVPKALLAAGFPDYDDASKNEVVAQILRTFTPPPGPLLARLLYIRTSDNLAPMRTVFVANLCSPDPTARKFSLLGLRELGHESLTDLALLLMRDTDDQVLSAAVDVLVPRAREDANLRSFLRGFHDANRGNARLHMSLSLMEAHGLAAPAGSKA